MSTHKFCLQNTEIWSALKQASAYMRPVYSGFVDGIQSRKYDIDFYFLIRLDLIFYMFR